MLSREEVHTIALLARIGLSSEEEEKYQRELSAVLDFFRELEQADTEGHEPIGHITGRTGEAREDVAEAAAEAVRAGIMENVPETKDGYVKVRSVF